MPEPAATALAATLRNIRGERSMQEMADDVGVTRQTWFNWETGSAFPDNGNLDKLAAALSVTVAELFDEVA